MSGNEGGGRHESPRPESKSEARTAAHFEEPLDDRKDLKTFAVGRGKITRYMKTVEGRRGVRGDHVGSVPITLDAAEADSRPPRELAQLNAGIQSRDSEGKGSRPFPVCSPER